MGDYKQFKVSSVCNKGKKNNSFKDLQHKVPHRLLKSCLKSQLLASKSISKAAITNSKKQQKTIPAGICFLDVNNKNNKTMCEICSE